MTAVEWFADELKQFGTHIPKLWLEKAKEIEKEQIKNSYHSGAIDGFNFRTTSISPNPEQYYNETFKSE